MKNQTYLTDINDRQWNDSKDRIPATKMGGCPRSLDMHQVINTLRYIVVRDIQWW